MRHEVAPEENPVTSQAPAVGDPGMSRLRWEPLFGRIDDRGERAGDPEVSVGLSPAGEHPTEAA
jgi:hypothetical protein